MVSFKFLAVALAGVAAAIDFDEWAQHNGLVSNYNQFYKESPELQNRINELDGDATIFLPTDNAWKRWQGHKNYSMQSYTASVDTFLYMIVNGRYTIKDLSSMNGESLNTKLQGQKVMVQTSGVVPGLTVAILSGSNDSIKSIAGRYQDDFQCNQAMIQLVDTVFQLPDNIFEQANKDTTQLPSAASFKAPNYGLTFLSAGAVITTVTSMLF